MQFLQLLHFLSWNIDLNLSVNHGLRVNRKKMQLHVPVLLGEFQGMFEPVFGAVGTVHGDQ